MINLKSWLLSLAACLCLTLQIFAQDTWTGAEMTQAVKIGTTRPLRDVLPSNPTDEFKMELWEESRPEYIRNFIGRRQESIEKPGTLPDGPDPLMAPSRDGTFAVTPVVNIIGQTQQQSNSGVPDVCGDVSDQYYMQVVNATWLQVYDLQGNKVGAAFRANTIWNQLGFTSAGDPILLFDQEADRWFLTEFPSSSRVLLGVSETSDPLGAWTAYAFTTPRFPDYPKYGIWPTAYVLTTNEGGGNIFFYTINRAQILAGENDIDIQQFSIPKFSDPGWQTAQPVDWNGMLDVAPGTLPMIMRINDDAYGDSPVDAVEIYEIEVNWTDATQSKVTETQIETSPYDSEFCSASGFGFACIPQPNGQGIDGIPYIFMNACHYRNFETHSSIVGNFTVDVTGDNDGGIRWVELRKTGDGPWELYQEGTVGSDDGLNRFMGGISIDSKGNIGLAYSVSSENTFPSLRYTGRRASDPLGKMTAVEYEFATGKGSFGDDRFGDYASMSVDKDDTFWYTGEYILANGQWSTGIVAFRLSRDSVDVGPRAISDPVDSPDLGMELITACVVNQGILPQTTFDIGLISGADTIIETVTIDSLHTDSVYCHTFSTPVDLSAFGPHEIIVFTSMPADSNALNDTCRFTILHKTTFDIAVARVEGLSQALCDTFTSLEFVLRNIGVAPLISADVIWSLNGGEPDTIHWTGLLEEGAVDGIPVDVTGLNPGNNPVEVYTELPNGMADQDMKNDTLRFGIFSTPGGQSTTLLLTTDAYPDETLWELLDDEGNLILQGGPYNEGETTYSEEWCLDTSKCYLFVLLDNFGDGIEGDGVEGNFQIVNGDGITVAVLKDAMFGFSDTTRFCLQSNCALVANTLVRHETAPGMANGTISVFSSGGVAPFQYSINGGTNYQSSSFFNGLAPGEYTVVVRDAFGCIFIKEVTILECDIQVLATVTPATGAEVADGKITISLEGNHGSAQYSLNGGTFQTSPTFTQLLPDTFTVTIKDSVNCTIQVEVVVDFSSATETYFIGSLVKVFPNPSSGYFEFEVEGLPGAQELRYDLLNAEGRVVKSGVGSNYSGIVKGSFSLKHEPSGEYFMRFRYPGMNRLITLIKL